MKFILENNLINEVEKIDNEVEKKSVVYTGYTLDGENIEVYDRDNGKLIPIVKFLLTGKKKGVGLFMLLGIISLIFLLIVLLYYGLSGKKEPIVNNNASNGIMGTLPSLGEKEKVIVQNNTLPVVEKEPEIKNDLLVGNNNINNSGSLNDSGIAQSNENQRLLDLKYQAEIEVIRKQFETEKQALIDSLNAEKSKQEMSNILNENQNLKAENETLKKENETLKVLLNEKKILTDKEAFIFFLGSETFKKCDINEQSQQCKDLYFNFINQK